MVGGGYIFSDDVARLIVLNNNLVRPIMLEMLYTKTEVKQAVCCLLPWVLAGAIPQIGVHLQVGLKQYTVEDATAGYWIQPWDVQHINHPRFRRACARKWFIT